MQSLVVREWGEIHKSEKNQQKSIDKIEINSSAFKDLEKFAESENKENRFLRFKKPTVLKVQNFVGVITTPDGTQIEILPKTNEISNEKSADKSRQTLEKMLKVVYKLPFIQTTKADLQLKNQPLPELLIRWFLGCVDEIIKQGIRKDYNRIFAHEKFLKGQLQTHKQLNEPPYKQHLFHIEYDVFSPNRSENRLIHSALLQILKWSKNNQNQKLSKHFLMFFDEVPLSKNYQIDFDKWSNSKDMNYYQAVLPWLKLILNQQTPFTLKDKNAGISFLLPMEKLFEKYVAIQLRKQLPQGYRLKEQISSKYLSNDPKAFLLKPDMAIYENDNLKYILDTKWKLINESLQDKKRDISQSDMYQLFAYGKKYNVEKVVLIYPKWKNFITDFSFTLDENLQLNVINFDIETDKIDLLH